MSVKEKMSALNSRDDIQDQSSNSENSLSEEACKEMAKSEMVYLKSEKVLDLGKMKATNYKFNKRIFLPKGETAEREALHEVRRMSMFETFKNTIKKSNDGGNKEDEKRVSSNLSKLELKGMKSLQKRVKNGELMITETDKSNRFCILKTSQYYEAGQKHVSKDQKISHEQVRAIQKVVNDHSFWLRKIFGLGVEWGHEDRIGNSMTDRGEVVAPLYLLIKDHKGWSYEEGSPPPPDQYVVATRAIIATSAKFCH